MNKIIKGGYLKDKKTYVVSSVGIMSAIKDDQRASPAVPMI